MSNKFLTRKEMYLAKIAGENVTPPTPETRDEVWLGYFAGLNEAPEPLTRAERWMSKIQLGGGSGDCDGIIARTMTKISSETAKSVGEYAFYSYELLKEVDFPALTNIELAAFKGCTALESINAPLVSVIAANAFQDSTLKKADFPQVTRIESQTFSSCNELETVNLPAVTEIVNDAFYSCAKLKNINIPAVTSIGATAFSLCKSLEHIELPSTNFLGFTAFSGCFSLASVDILVETLINNRTFSGCNMLETLILRSNTMSTLAYTNAFSGTPIESGAGYIYVPAALVNSYKEAENWSDYINQIRAIEDYPEICGQ